MALLKNYVLPRLTHLACGASQITAERAAMIPRAAGTVVEIGFGSGRNLSFYDQAKVTRIIGIEPSRGLLDLVKAPTEAPSFEMIEGVGEAVPLATASADTVVMSYTLCSVDDPARVLGEAKRVLKPGGHLIMIEHGRSPLPGVARWQDLLNPAWRMVAGGCNLNRDTPALARAAGFDLAMNSQSVLAGVPRVLGTHYAVEGLNP